MLAERAGLSARAISDLERAVNHLPRADTLRLLVAALDLSEAERVHFEAATRRLRAVAARDPAAAPSGPGERGSTAAPAPPTRNPYKGLRPFSAADSGDFFGRERLIAAALARLQAAPTAGPRFLGLVGASGAGKSSLLLAGVLPRLRAGALPGSAAWSYLEPLVPGAHPLEALSVTLGRALPASSLRAIRADLGEGARVLHRLASRLVSEPTSPTSRVVLVVDQAEELFTLTTDEAERRLFIDLLVTAAGEPRGPTLVLLTLRADFYDRPLAYPALGRLLHAHSLVLLPLTPAELREAIERPAGLPDVQLRFEDELVSELMLEVQGQAGALPLVQFTLEALVQRRAGHLLTRAAYAAIGGVRGALARQAEATFAVLPTEEHRTLARALFLRLIDPGVTEQDTTRRRAAQSELTLPDVQQTALLREVANAFVDARLLTTSEYAGLTMLEVSHEALIREWARLSGWLHEAREDVRRQQTISTDAAAWARRGRPADNLYRGTVLQEAQAWAARNVASVEEVAFLEASVAEGRRQEAAQRAMQERELALARQAAEANRRAATRSRSLAALLALFLLVAIGLSTYAFNNASLANEARTRAAASARTASLARAEALAERNQARANASAAVAAQHASLTALSRQVVLQVGGLTDSQPEIAMLLSVEANRLSNTAAARVALFRLVANDARLTHVLDPQTGAVYGVVYSPDGQMLATAGWDRAIRLWDVATGRPLGLPLVGQTGYVTCVAFSPDSKVLASGGADGAIWLWDVARGHQLGPPLRGQTAAVNSVAFSPDGTTLASGGADGAIRLWDVVHRHSLSPVLTGQTGSVNSVAFSPSGTTLASGSFDGTIRLWDISRGHQLGRPLRGQTGSVNSVAFSPDGKTLASGSADTTIRLWDTARRHAFVSALNAGSGVVPFGSAIRSVAFSPDGRVLASGDVDGAIRFWDVAQGHQLGPPLNGSILGVSSIAFNPDGAILASGGADGTIQLWNVTRRQSLGSPLAGHTDNVGSLAFSPDGTLLASGSKDTTIRLWDVARRQAIGSPLTGHAGSVNSVAFSPDGKTLASGSTDTTIRLWDVARRRQLGRPLNRLSSPVNSVAFSPDGKTLASGSGRMNGSLAASLELAGTDYAVRLWDVASRQPFAMPLTGHTEGISSIAFSPNGTILASGSADASVRLWDVAGGQSLGALPNVNTEGAPSAEATRYAIDSVAFSPGGTILASGSDDGTIQLWYLDPVSLVRRGCQIATRNLTRQEWRQYFGELAYHKTCPGVPAGT
jgi:WD40 repeat protein